MTGTEPNYVQSALRYDSQNHLVTMNGGAVQLLYDWDGNRVAKSVNGVGTCTMPTGCRIFDNSSHSPHEPFPKL